ncbi:hypothetical protein FS749_012063 [Ceratobasidium sp. UAMH 11750]|nr:hypothetical protein FS749_012063 [Ceratobasidium sp. UAMH 11750]
MASTTWYLHLGSRAQTPPRPRAFINCLGHPTHETCALAARLITSLDMGTVHFEYVRLNSVEEAMTLARGEMDIRESSKGDLLLTYLNGPRLLSTERTAYLVIARDSAGNDEWHLFLCALHCIGGGMALHTCANEMLLLLGAGRDAVGSKKLLEEALEHQMASTLDGRLFT